MRSRLIGDADRVGVEELEQNFALPLARPSLLPMPREQ